MSETATDASTDASTEASAERKSAELTSEAREVADLTRRITELRHQYYEGDQSTASDQEYDALVRRLQSLEQQHPELLRPDSPTQTVGGAPETALFAPVVHREPMLSLDNVFSRSELEAWAEKVQRDAAKVAPERPIRWLSELKIDGLAINLRYEHGVLTSAATRGDGITGEDVTPNVRTMGTIPMRLQGSGHPDLVEVRGEIFFPVANFDELNARQAAAGERLFANSRNA